MSKINNAIQSIEKIEELSARDTYINRIHPLFKLCATIFYLVLVVSYKGTELTGILGMALYPFFLFEISGLSFRDALYRLRVVLPFILIIGVFNPIFDSEPLLYIGNLTISSGLISMLSLMLKGILTVLATYLLIATTSVDKICYAMRMLHVPKVLVIEFLLICRYITMFLEEVERMTQSYSLRAPGQKGIMIRSWGSFVGHLLLRSMDRAEVVYQSMCMRGFNGEFYVQLKKNKGPYDMIGFIVLVVCLILLRVYPVLEIIGNLFV